MPRGVCIFAAWATEGNVRTETHLHTVCKGGSRCHITKQGPTDNAEQLRDTRLNADDCITGYPVQTFLHPTTAGPTRTHPYKCLGPPLVTFLPCDWENYIALEAPFNYPIISPPATKAEQDHQSRCGNTLSRKPSKLWCINGCLHLPKAKTCGIPPSDHHP